MVKFQSWHHWHFFPAAEPTPVTHNDWIYVGCGLTGMWYRKDWQYVGTGIAGCYRRF